MKYIILCGSNHQYINGVPRQLVTIKGERILDRTIRLLRDNGISDMAITSLDHSFDDCGIEVINYDSNGPWINCFLPRSEPTCYIFGDVYFSFKAIETIVQTQTDDIEFFASAPAFAPEYSKPWGEPFAFKVVNQEHFHEAIKTVKELTLQNAWRRDPIAWELWQIIKKTPINIINYHNYITINDYTCDVDCEADVISIERKLL